MSLYNITEYLPLLLVVSRHDATLHEQHSTECRRNERGVKTTTAISHATEHNEKSKRYRVRNYFIAKHRQSHHEWRIHRSAKIGLKMNWSFRYCARQTPNIDT